MMWVAAAVVVIWFCEKRVWIFVEIRTAYPITFFYKNDEN